MYVYAHTVHAHTYSHAHTYIDAAYCPRAVLITCATMICRLARVQVQCSLAKERTFDICHGEHICYLSVGTVVCHSRLPSASPASAPCNNSQSHKVAKVTCILRRCAISASISAISASTAQMRVLGMLSILRRRAISASLLRITSSRT